MKKALILINALLLLILLCFTIFKTTTTNYTFVYVQSNSMSNSEIYKGNTYLVKSKDDYVVGDIIAFKTNSDTIYFHELIKIDDSGKYITKGSSNPLPDSWEVNKDNVIGYLVTNKTFNWINNTGLIISIIALTYVFLVFIVIMTIISIIKENRDISENTTHTSKRIAIVSVLLLLLIVGCSFMLTSGYATSNANVYCNISIKYENNLSNFTHDSNGTIVNYDNNCGEDIVYIPRKDVNGNPVTKVDDFVFTNNDSIEVLIIPETVTSLGWINFINCPKLRVIIVLASNPITQWNSYLGLQLSRTVKIYVPDNCINKYKKATGWNKFSSQISGLSNCSEKY